LHRRGLQFTSSFVIQYKQICKLEYKNFCSIQGMLLLLLHDAIDRAGPPPGPGSTYSERLLWALAAAGKSQSDLARDVGVSPQSIQYLCDPANNARGSRNTSAFAAALGVHPNWLARGEGPPARYAEKEPSAGVQNVEHVPAGKRQVPVLSYVQAGHMTEAGCVDLSQVYDDYLTTDLELSEQSFALEIKGDSMVAPPGTADESFYEGDRIVVDCRVTPLPGDYVVARNGDHEATFKKYRPRGVDEQGREVFELLPLNPDYPPMRSDRQAIQIIGVMVEHRRYRKRR
jgi:SOS-response transcriptional repressor LexA